MTGIDTKGRLKERRCGEKVKKKYCLLKDEGVDFDGEGQLLDESIVYVFEGGRSNEITFL